MGVQHWQGKPCNCMLCLWCACMGLAQRAPVHALTLSVAGAKQEGAMGVFKGIGRGTAGLLLKPIGGIIDFTSSNLTSLKK